jgi:hypothetical protein
MGSSDAHDVSVLGICYTEFPVRIQSNHDLVQAIRSRSAVARERTRRFQAVS